MGVSCKFSLKPIHSHFFEKKNTFNVGPTLVEWLPGARVRAKSSLRCCRVLLGWCFWAIGVPKRMPKSDEKCALPSGKRLHNYGKSSFLMGKSTINDYKWTFSIAMLVYQRVPGCDARWCVRNPIISRCPIVQRLFKGVSIGETSPRLFLGTPSCPDECIKNGFDFSIGIFGILLDY